MKQFIYLLKHYIYMVKLKQFFIFSYCPECSAGIVSHMLTSLKPASICHLVATSQEIYDAGSTKL